ncbi:MAG: hypothetical protein WCP85_30955 [Mariniphaga sp.]
MGWLIFFGILFLFILGGLIVSKQVKENEQSLKSKGFDLSAKIVTGKYVGGHPKIDNVLESTIIFPKDEYLQIMAYPSGITSMPVTKGIISIEKIKNITIEDNTSLEKRITAGRLLLVGVFALAWKKKKKNESAFLIIEWQDGKFGHETTFEFEGKGSMQNANTARNKLIEIAK